MDLKFTFDDLKIGDLVKTTSNKIGEIIALKSYAYLNDKINKKSKKDQAELHTFKFDGSRHNGIWYAAVTVAIEVPDSSVPTYYVDQLDFIEIKEIIGLNPKKENLKRKIEKIFKF